MLICSICLTTDTDGVHRYVIRCNWISEFFAWRIFMNIILATISILFAVSFLFSKPWKSYMSFIAKLSDKTVRYFMIVFLAGFLVLLFWVTSKTSWSDITWRVVVFAITLMALAEYVLFLFFPWLIRVIMNYFARIYYYWAIPTSAIFFSLGMYLYTAAPF